MKNLLLTVFLLSAFFLQAQIGVGTTSPHSTLDVRGAFATPVTTFTANTTAGGSDNLLVFTGTSATTLTLPTAVGITGREYWVKNASSNGSTLTIATTSSQTIDGVTSWSLTQQYKAIRLVSNGANWYAADESLPGSSGTPWVLGGNNVGSLQNIGTTSNYALPFLTNNTERMRIANTGNVAIGTSTWDATNPEKLLVDAGTTSSINVISGKGSINNYLQLNIQNRSAGSAASSDIVATADNGTESVNYVDLGINSSAYSSTGVLGGADNAYLYSAGNDFAIGNSTSNKDLLFFTGGTATTNERMRILSGGNVGIGTSAPSANLHVVNSGTTTNNIAQFLNPNLATTNASYIKLGKSLSNGDAADIVYNWTSANGSSNYLGFSFYGKPLYMLMNNAGNVYVGSNSTFDATNPEKLLVDAGTTSSFNVISGKGTINNYLQLNIQNKSNGALASSDVVATADNGTETVNFIDMGINSSAYSSSGILAGVNNAYLYSTGNDLVLGNATSSKDVIIFTGGTATTNERIRATANGMTVTGSHVVSFRSGTGNYTLLATDYVVINTGAAATWTLPAASGCSGRVYRLLNQGTGNITLSLAVTTANGTTSTTLVNTAGSNFYEILSDGTVWRRIN